MNSFETAELKSFNSRQAEERIGDYDWTKLANDLSAFGCAVVEKLLSADECRQISALYADEGHSQPYSHGASRLRQRGISVFQISAARNPGGAKNGVISQTSCRRE